MYNRLSSGWRPLVALSLAPFALAPTLLSRKI